MTLRMSVKMTNSLSVPDWRSCGTKTENRTKPCAVETSTARGFFYSLSPCNKPGIKTWKDTLKRPETRVNKAFWRCCCWTGTECCTGTSVGAGTGTECRIRRNLGQIKDGRMPSELRGSYFRWRSKFLSFFGILRINGVVRGQIERLQTRWAWSLQTADRISSTLTAFYEQAAAAVILLPFVMNTRVQPSVSDVLQLLFLGIITTALAHTLFIHSLKTLPAQIAGVCSAMKTVYGILFALLLLGEIPTVREILGAVIIIGTVLIAQTRTE